MEKKMTKRDCNVIIKDIVLASDCEDKDDLIKFLDNEIEILDRKAEKAKERAAQKRAEGDELRALVQSKLTNDYQTIKEICSTIEDEEITKAKVVARLTQLVKEGIAEKEDVKTEDNKKVKAYRLISE